MELLGFVQMVNDKMNISDRNATVVCTDLLKYRELRAIICTSYSAYECNSESMISVLSVLFTIV